MHSEQLISNKKNRAYFIHLIEKFSLKDTMDQYTSIYCIFFIFFLSFFQMTFASEPQSSVLKSNFTFCYHKSNEYKNFSLSVKKNYSLYFCVTEQIKKTEFLNVVMSN